MQNMDLAALEAFLRSEEASHRTGAETLAADSRGDEANFEKIRANVFGIFSAVLETAVKKYGENGEAAEFFARKLREIPEGWRRALTAARERGDSAAVLTEKLKLESVAEIEGRMKK